MPSSSLLLLSWQHSLSKPLELSHPSSPVQLQRVSVRVLAQVFVFEEEVPVVDASQGMKMP
jgi:hypothetical protein